MNQNQKTLDKLLYAMDFEDRVTRFDRSQSFGNNCEWCGRIRRSKKRECVMNREARMIARGFK